MEYLDKKYRKTTHWLDRFLQTESSFLISGGSWSIFARIISSLLILGLSFAFARYLTKEIYGTYKYVLSIISMLGFVALPGIYTSYLRAAAKENPSYIRQGIRNNFYLSFLITVVGVLISLNFFLRGDNSIGLLILVASFLAPIEEGTKGFIGWLILNRRFKQRAYYTIIYNLVNVFTLATAVAFVYVYEIEIYTALMLLITAHFVSKGIVRIFYLLRSFREIPHFNSTLPRKEINKYGLHLSLSRILSPIAVHLDSVILFALLGPQTLATYSFAIAIPEQAKGLVLSFRPITQLKIFSKSRDSLRLLPKKLIKISIFMVFGVLLYFFIAPYIYELLFPRYSDAVNLSRVFALSLIVIPISAILDNAIDALGNVKNIYVVNMSTQIVQIVSIIILIVLFGIWGAVIARLIARVYNALLMIYFVRK